MTEDEKNIIISLNTFPTIKKDTILLREGQKSNEAYFILKGVIRTYYLIDGVEKTSGFYTEKEALTPHCVINKTPSEYYISCIEDSIITISTPEMEVEIFNKFPKFVSLCRVLLEEPVAIDAGSFRLVKEL
ncbi:cyclic nucleotide-binding domain-containing protein [Dyadobacter sp. CY345]|uniref:Crp/Fnr family transcriptional regulator n=1 Tax=Dyadobacter sp. CY345 TaxID=2909335 RepID=UPI00286E3523|nr:cyclic nucleotide-binding domain-containing protein [Dyadobacter sp. CY345]